MAMVAVVKNFGLGVNGRAGLPQRLNALGLYLERASCFWAVRSLRLAPCSGLGPSVAA